MNETTINIDGSDLPIELLSPLRKRYMHLDKSRGYKRILASIKAIGLIEPLCVFKEKEQYVILDGYLRYKACEEIGAQTIPCLIYPDKEAYTYNKMVNKLSPVQQNRMIQKALETIDRKTITQTLGIAKLESSLTDSVLKALHAKVINLVENNIISKHCAADFVHVSLARQKEIVHEMDLNNEYGPHFARTLILRTPADQRSRWKGKAAPWQREPERKKEMVARLQEAEQKHDFFSNLYRDYMTDLMKLSVYVRQLLTHETIGPLIQQRHHDIYQRLQGIILHETAKDSA